MSAWEGIKRSVASAALFAAALVAALFLGACAGPTSRIVQRGVFERTPSLTVDSITGPVRGDGLGELATLQRLPPSPANELRRAFILSENGDRNGAVAIANRLLYGEEPPTAATEALARYVRARASRGVTSAEEVDADVQRARELTADSAFLALLDAEFAGGRATVVAAPAPVEPTGTAWTAPPILPRATWNARPIDRGDVLPLGRPTCITVHHTTILLHSTSAKVAAAQLYQIQGDHQRSNGWADIGYHFLIDRAGRVWEGRELRWQGAHAGGTANRGNIGVCLLGRFLRGGDGQEPSPQQAESLERLLRWLGQEYGIDAAHIYPHRRFKATECPGPRLEAVMNDIRRRMERSAQS
ncbi:MAG: peptidoglycan recognition family protein [Planctomycetota bacterium]